MSVAAKEETKKTKRGLLGLGADLSHSHGHLDVIPSLGHSHGHLDSISSLGHSHGHLDLVSGHGLGGLSGLSLGSGLGANSEIHAAQEHINAAQLNGLSGLSGAGQLGAAQGHLLNAQLGNGLGGLNGLSGLGGLNGLGGGLGGLGGISTGAIALSAPAPLIRTVQVPVVRNIIQHVDRPVPVPYAVDRPGKTRKEQLAQLKFLLISNIVEYKFIEASRKSPIDLHLFIIYVH